MTAFISSSPVRYRLVISPSTVRYRSVSRPVTDPFISMVSEPPGHVTVGTKGVEVDT